MCAQPGHTTVVARLPVDERIFTWTIRALKRCWPAPTNSEPPPRCAAWRFQRYQGKPRLLARWLTDTVGLCRRHGSSRTRTMAVDFTGFARAGQPLRPAAGRHTPPRPDVTAVVGGGVDRPPGPGWTENGPRAARGPCRVSPPGGTHPSPAALHAPAGPKADPGTRHMQQRAVVLHLLLPPDEPPSQPVHPRVGTLHHPAACPLARHLALGLPFCTTVPTMSPLAPRLQRFAHGLIVAPLVHTPVRRPPHRRFGARAHEGLQGGVNQLHSMTSRAVHGDAEWQAMASGQQAPCGPKLPALGRVLAHRFPHPGEPWSSPHPWPAPPTRALSAHRTAATPPARAARTLGRLAMRASERGLCWERRDCAAGLAMGSRGATPTRGRSALAGRPSGAGPPAAWVWAVAGRAPSAPRGPPEADRQGPPQTRRQASWSPPVNHCGEPNRPCSALFG
jgi:hypothetical protein